MTEPKKKADLLEAIERMRAEDELEEVMRMSDAEIAEAIRADGGDPEAMGARGAALAKKRIEDGKTHAWHRESEAKIEAVAARAKERERNAKLPREELLRRIEVARRSPRFAEPVAMMFRKKSAEASSDEELADLLADIELLEGLQE